VNSTTTATEYYELDTYLGQNINNVNLPEGEYYPIVDRDTLEITGFVFADEPGEWDTAAIVDGELRIGEHFTDFVVAK
jgi:hypothetical protein